MKQPCTESNLPQALTNAITVAPLIGGYSISGVFKLPKFFPPTVDEGPAGLGLFYRYKHKRGKSVLKISGTYQVIRVPSTDQIDSATEYYAGGHEYEVTNGVKSALIAANIGITESNFQ